MRCSVCGIELSNADNGILCRACREHLLERRPEQTLHGWRCPRCQLIHAPWVPACACPPQPYILNTTQETR